MLTDTLLRLIMCVLCAGPLLENSQPAPIHAAVAVFMLIQPEEIL